MEAAVSSHKKTSAAKSRGRKDDPASEAGDSEDGAVPSRNKEVCDNDSEPPPPPLASKVAHSRACQDGTALLPKRSRTANRGETFDDNRREEMEAVPRSTGAASAVVGAPQVVPSAPVDAPTTEVRCSGSSTGNERK
ncbi:hypothetical protein MTO96_039018 [Rhipicephalus appendiculatus]